MGRLTMGGLTMGGKTTLPPAPSVRAFSAKVGTGSA